MGWKDWPYWLKGGIIYTLYLYIGYVLNLIVSLIGGGIEKLFSMITYIPVAPIDFLIDLFILPVFDFLDNLKHNEKFYFLFILIVGIFYFLAGAIIGWLYGKLKSRGKK